MTMKTHCTYTLIEDYSVLSGVEAKDRSRSGEGSIVRLNNGDHLLLYSRFFGGGGDASPGEIVSRRSADGGVTWSAYETVFSRFDGSLNNMSVSLLRLRDGRIGGIFGLKWSEDHTIPHWFQSDDEGHSWSQPVPITAHKDYFVVNNDRLLEMRDGTLVVPYARHPAYPEGQTERAGKERWNGICGLIFSRDGGRTWQTSPHTIQHTPDYFTLPDPYEPDGMDEESRSVVSRRCSYTQEPGVMETPDGGMFLYARSLWKIFTARSTGVDQPWEDVGHLKGFNVCCGPQTIRPVPGSDRWVMFYNDRGAVPYGHPDYNLRTPLAVAISGDCGRNWSKIGELEDASRNYCYFSLLLDEDQFITSYYQSGTAINAEGVERRINLASLKVCTGPTSLFLSPRIP